MRCNEKISSQGEVLRSLHFHFVTGIQLSTGDSQCNQGSMPCWRMLPVLVLRLQNHDRLWPHWSE